ncbi:hypothetical protein [Streptomyces sp. NPDC001851]|uniref:hypothetical protein n=1 Tax=Streptomyces sp. NPDC001851 TaxID=3154529 RepID=UPI00332FDD25
MPRFRPGLRGAPGRPGPASQEGVSRAVLAEAEAFTALAVLAVIEAQDHVTGP